MLVVALITNDSLMCVNWESLTFVSCEMESCVKVVEDWQVAITLNISRSRCENLIFLIHQDALSFPDIRVCFRYCQ